MFKRCFSPLSLVNQVILIVLLLAVLGGAALATAGWLGQGIQGSAHAINKAGSLRMQSYRLLAAVPLRPADRVLLDEMTNTANSSELSRAAIHDHQAQKLEYLKSRWLLELAPALQTARHQQQVQGQVEEYVSLIDELVTSFDQQTEKRIQQVIILQMVMAVLMGMLLIFTIIWLRKRLLMPWRQLMSMATAVGHGDFSKQVHIHGRNEMATLGDAFNSMSAELAESYASLENHVAEKTARLEQKNQMLSFLYWANRQLHSQAGFSERVTPVLTELQQLTPLCEIELRVYEYEDEEHYQEFALLPTTRCEAIGCTLCPTGTPTDYSGAEAQTWRLTDTSKQYGLVLAKLPAGSQLTDDQQQLISTLMEQLTTTLALERQSERQQQFMVMEERSAIARELHDSIAQSLSCMKMQVSCLQMQGDAMPEASQELLGQIRNELNSSWRQLRELLTTFRLQLSEPGLRPALEACRAEFSEKLGFTVDLAYQLPPRLVPYNQAIHLVQIAREALNNVFKHAGASAATIQVMQQDDSVILQVEDNGCGIPENGERRNHYGLIIMRDRAEALKGECQIHPRPEGGTRVTVRFVPEGQSASQQENNNE